MTARKILFLGYYTGFAGGIERYAFQSAVRLRQAGAQVDWCGSVPDRDEDLFRSGFDRVLSPEELAGSTGEYDLAALHKLPTPERLKEWRVRFGEKLVFWAHDHDLYCPRRHYYTPFGRINCHRAYSPCRCAVCARISHPRHWKHLRRGQGKLLAELRGHHAVVLSGFMRDNLIRNGFVPERIHLIGPVIEAGAGTDRVPSAGNELKILFLGQLIRGKGCDLLLEALHRLTIPWHAKIAGDGFDRPMLEKRAGEMELGSRIEFTSWLTDPAAALRDCDVLVFPSRWQEPFGLSGAEAAACGKPVIAFDVGGVREWLQDQVNGFIVPEKNTAEMAEKLEQLYHDPALRARMGKAGRTLVEQRFAPSLFPEKIEELIRRVQS